MRKLGLKTCTQRGDYVTTCPTDVLPALVAEGERVQLHYEVHNLRQLRSASKEADLFLFESLEAVGEGDTIVDILQDEDRVPRGDSLSRVGLRDQGGKGILCNGCALKGQIVRLEEGIDSALDVVHNEEAILDGLLGEGRAALSLDHLSSEHLRRRDLPIPKDSY